MAEPKNRILIYGTGQIGNMVASILELDSGVRIVGFVDDDQSKWGREFHGYQIFGGFDILQRSSLYDEITVALGQVEPRRAAAKRVRALGIPQYNTIHPSALISKDCILGEGCIIGAGVTLFVNPSIGNNVFIGPSVVVSHDSVVGDYALLSVGSVIGARVDIEPGAFVGAGATVMPPGWGTDSRLRVGSNAVVGVGAVVIRDVDERAIVAGVPAKLLRYREDAK
jgi:sugar O-acyltransferase (sialic acid O-acetyltransferase NeuD family)